MCSSSSFFCFSKKKTQKAYLNSVQRRIVDERGCKILLCSLWKWTLRLQNVTSYWKHLQLDILWRAGGRTALWQHGHFILKQKVQSCSLIISCHSPLDFLLFRNFSQMSSINAMVWKLPEEHVPPRPFYQLSLSSPWQSIYSQLKQTHFHHSHSPKTGGDFWKVRKTPAACTFSPLHIEMHTKESPLHVQNHAQMWAPDSCSRKQKLETSELLGQIPQTGPQNSPFAHKTSLQCKNPYHLDIVRSCKYIKEGCFYTLIYFSFTKYAGILPHSVYCVSKTDI